MMSKNNNKSLIYIPEKSNDEIEVVFKEDTLWLSQKQMAQLFEKDSDTIGLHIRNVYKTGELTKEGTTEKYSVVQKEGVRKVKRKLNFYNLDMIISVGYRVNSIRGTQFRIWATHILKEQLLKGYSLHKQLLQNKPQKLKALKKDVEEIEKGLKKGELTEINRDNLLNTMKDIFDLIKKQKI